MKSNIDIEYEQLMRLSALYWDAWEFYVATHQIPMPPVASGETLDRLGELFELTRNPNETDEDLRSRICAKVA